MLAELEDNPVIKEAAAVAERFALDPLEVLRADRLDAMIRLACYNASVTDENERNAAANKGK